MEKNMLSKYTKRCGLIATLILLFSASNAATMQAKPGTTPPTAATQGHVGIPTSGDELITTESSLLVYATHGTWSPKLGGVAGADQKCQSDAINGVAQCPSGAVCKAIIGTGYADAAKRYPTPDGLSPAYDWVLYPKMKYAGTDHVVASITNINAIFMDPNAFDGIPNGGTGGTGAWTGVAKPSGSQWSVWIVKGSDKETCKEISKNNMLFFYSPTCGLIM